MATLKGDRIVWDYRGLPSTINPDEKKIDLAEIKFATNSAWDFKMYLINRDDPLWQLNIDTADGGRFYITTGGDNDLQFPGFHDSGNRFSLENYKQTILNDLNELMGYEDMNLSKTNK